MSVLTQYDSVTKKKIKIGYHITANDIKSAIDCYVLTKK